MILLKPRFRIYHSNRHESFFNAEQKKIFEFNKLKYILETYWISVTITVLVYYVKIK